MTRVTHTRASEPGPRVVLLVPAFPKLSETFVVRQYLGLRRRGWDVHVVCARSSEAEWAHFPELDDSDRRRVHTSWTTTPRALAAALLPFQLLRCLLRRPLGTLGYLLRAFRASSASTALRRLYTDAELLLLAPGLLHFEFGSLAAERLQPVELSPVRLLDYRCVVSFRGFDLNFVGLGQPDFYRPVWQNAHGLHFLGEDLRDRARRRGWHGSTIHALVPPAVNGERFQPRSGNGTSDAETPEPLRILGVARLEWKKGYEDALSALALLRDRGIDFRYTIIGDGEHRPALCLAIYQLGLEDRVTLEGVLPPREVARKLEESDIFLHLAVSEGFCNAVLEAQAMALPVVASDADGLAENVAHGETGWIVPRRDPEAACRALEQLAGDPGLRERMGRAGRRRVLEHFRPEAEIEAFENLYRTVASRESGGRQPEVEP